MSSPNEPIAPWYRRHAVLLLLPGLMLVGGALRFTLLDHPTLWGDEAMTYSRVSGSYRDMLERLRDDGFPPLHYTAYWLLAQVVTLTPFWMRFIPALAGTLMIPAMYALARQFVAARTSLVVALYTAVSAYLLVYSRDAKMYMHFWLLVVLHLTCLIIWIRTGRRRAWWGWVVAGIAMIGTSMTGAAIIAVGPLLLLTGRDVRWWRTVFYLIGLGLIIAGPIYYYTQFNQWVSRVEDNPRRTGIVWVERYNAEREGPDLVMFTASAFLLSWEWPTAVDLPTIPPRLLTTLKTTVVALLGIALLGLIPWPRRWMPRRQSGIERPWRAVFWLALLLVIPVYGFYCASIPGASRPSDWLLWITGHMWMWLAAALLLLGWVVQGILRPDREARWLIELPLALGLTTGALFIVHSTVPTWDYSVWMPRYLGFTWPAFAIALCWLLMRLPTRPVRITVITLLVLVNLAQFVGRAFGPTEPPLDLAARDIQVGLNDPGNTTRTYNMIPDPSAGAPGTATLGGIPMRYYLDIQNGTRHTPTELRQGFYRFYRLRRARTVTDIQRDLAQSNHLERIIVWARLLPADQPRSAELFGEQPSPGNGWRRVAFTRYPIFDHWKWQRLSTWYRWEYTRDPQEQTSEKTIASATLRH